ncbi:MAG: phospholipid carrier-dependent glycosyltransferase [Thermoleophilaceae bacterium]
MAEMPEPASASRMGVHAETRLTRALAHSRAPIAVLIVIVAVGAALRLTGNDWDSGAHLHPDERYLSIVSDNVEWPLSVGGYFDVERSPLSPYNTEPGQAYVYGQLPLITTKGVATLIGRDGYDELYLVGRRLSAILDIASIVLVFLIGSSLLLPFGRRIATWGALLGAALYALSALAIQLSHFFTVESWLVFSTLLAFYLALLVGRRPLDAGRTGSLALLAGTGSAVALATASKASGLLVLLPVVIALALRPGGGLDRTTRALSIVGSLLAVAVAGYLTFRLVSPYAFEHSSWLDLRPNERYRAALEAQQRAIGGEFLYPPAYQWLLSEPFVDPLRNLVVWGLGLPLGIAAVAGTIWLLVDAARRVRRGSQDATRAVPLVPLMLLAFVIVTFAYFGSRFAHSIRYLVPIVPFLCVCAAFAFVALHRRSRGVAIALAAALLAGTLLYAVSFQQIYRRPHTRVVASEWIYANAPEGSSIVSEHWDDGLPVGAPPDRYRLRQLAVFDPDDGSKLRKLYDGLAGADYYVLSSPRASATIGRLPDRFPLMSRFYRLLEDGQLGFRRAASFTSYPGLFGVELVDRDAEEAFWVYDHPPVAVYERVAPVPWPRFRGTVCSYGPAPGCVRSR